MARAQRNRVVHATIIQTLHTPIKLIFKTTSTKMTPPLIKNKKINTKETTKYP